MQNYEVMPAFEMLLEELEAVVSALNQQGASLLADKKYSQARQVISKAEAVLALQKKVKTLRDEWVDLSIPTSRIGVDGLMPGLRTPNEDFHLSILQALVQLGGSGRVGEVLDLVEDMLKDQLNTYDYQSLPSNPNIIRWRNNAQWARLILKQEGCLAADSPRGLWEITAAGRKALETMHNKVSDQQGFYFVEEKRLQTRQSEPPFIEGRRYHRQDDLHDHYGGNPQSGIAPCANYPFIFLFTSSSGDEHGYQDSCRSETEYLYTGEGQFGDMEMTRGNRAILNHVEDGRELHLFKKISSGEYAYVGQFAYQSHSMVAGDDTEGKSRQMIQFRLKKL